MLSIIIPSWNEEKYLPKLLSCIEKQTYRNYEVIVADADSSDNTKKIAETFGCKIVNGGMPAVGRNNGAKVAKGDILLFLDADVQFDSDFLKTFLDQIRKRRLDIAGVYIQPLSNKPIDRVLLEIFNTCIFIAQFFYASAFGGGIYCRKKLYEKVKGFDETIMLGEDLDFTYRASKHGKFGILRKPRLHFSMRRFNSEGRLKVAIRHTLSATYRIILGQIRSDIFRYNLRYKR